MNQNSENSEISENSENSENSDNSVVLLIKEVEEEIEGGVAHGHPFGGAEGAVAAVADGAVALYRRDGGVVGVSDGLRRCGIEI